MAPAIRATVMALVVLGRPIHREGKKAVRSTTTDIANLLEPRLTPLHLTTEAEELGKQILYIMVARTH